MCATPRLMIRPAERRDASRIAELADQLGYHRTPNEIRDRVEHLRDHATHAVFVAATTSGEILGWLHVFGEPRLLSDLRAEIAGLIVDDRARGRGVGRALVQQAEAWATGQGCHGITVRSNTLRTDAAEFYLKLGYETVKTQRVFRKDLSMEPGAVTLRC